MSTAGKTNRTTTATRANPAHVRAAEWHHHKFHPRSGKAPMPQKVWQMGLPARYAAIAAKINGTTGRILRSTQVQ
jgi:hypothetical protein